MSHPNVEFSLSRRKHTWGAREADAGIAKKPVEASVSQTNGRVTYVRIEKGAARGTAAATYLEHVAKIRFEFKFQGDLNFGWAEIAQRHSLE